MAGDGSSVRFGLFPFPAHGHFSAFLSLAARINRANLTADIVLVSTPRNVVNLRRSASSSSSPAAQAPYLRFHALPFVPADHGLPANAESADTLPIHHFTILFDAIESPSFQDSFDAFVGDCTTTDGGGVVVVVADPLLAWTTAIARRHGVPHALFVSCGAFGIAVYHSLWNHLPHLRRLSGDADGAFTLPDHPEVTVHRSQLPPHLLHADGTDRTTAYYHRLISAAYDTDAVLINTMEELEPAGLRMARKNMAASRSTPLARSCVVSAPTTTPATTTKSTSGWTAKRKGQCCTYHSGHITR
uniref:Uncharacterized protein n=1 Tax=Leersia perrieri TaxID=77586 RepID=A0A0D9W323_9ORYZ